jgi:hypothetical protein
MSHNQLATAQIWTTRSALFNTAIEVSPRMLILSLWPSQCPRNYMLSAYDGIVPLSPYSFSDAYGNIIDNPVFGPATLTVESAPAGAPTL